MRSPALAVSTVLLMGIGVAALTLPPLRELRTVHDLTFALVVPLSAWILTSVFAFTIPSFLGRRIARPHAFVLPFVFFAFTLAASTFWDYREVSLVAPRPRLLITQLWIAPVPLLATFIIQAVGIWLLAERSVASPVR